MQTQIGNPETTTLGKIQWRARFCFGEKAVPVVSGKEIIELSSCDLERGDFFMHLEQDFDIPISDEDVERAKTVGDLERIIDNKLAIKSGSAQ